MFLGCGGYAIVQKAIHNGFSSTDKKHFAKEAKLLHDINHANIVKIVGVSEDPIAIVMGFLHFDFRPFCREGSFSNLDDLLSYMNDEVIFFHFPKLACFMAKHFLSAVDFLHKNNMVHRDIKPSNILVSNLHYDFTIRVINCFRMNSENVACEGSEKNVEVSSYITGHHAYKNIWTPVLGEICDCHPDRGNAYDDFAVKVVNNEGTTIWHVPRELSKELSGYFNGGGRILVDVVSKRENRWRRGLEVPAVYRVI